MHSPDIEVIGFDDHHCSAIWRNIVITVWKKDTNIEAVQEITRATLRLQQLHPRGVGVFMVIERGASLPSDVARTAIAEMITAIAERLVGCSYVFEADGFAAAAVRYVIVGLTLLARPRYEYTIVKTVAEAATWMSARTQPTAHGSSRQEIENAVARIRRLGADTGASLPAK